MKIRIKRIVRGIIFTLILIFSIAKLDSLLQLKESDQRYSSFFTEKNEIEVLFIGSSHVRHGIFPMELWEEYGITSYNLGGNGNTIPVSYWTLVNALDYQQPKLVVMDVFDIWPGRKVGEIWGQMHTTFNAFPFSLNKYRVVEDLFDDENMTDGYGSPIYHKRWDILFDLGEYHTRWNDLSQIDFYNQEELKEESSVWKGASPLAAVVERNEHTYVQNDNLYYDEIAKDYLKRIIELCKERDIQLLLINTGWDCNDEAKYFADSVNEISAHYGIKYIDFTKLDIINFETDLHSSGHNTHLNFSGAEKFTDYIGKIISTEYQLYDYRNDKNYNTWWEDYKRYSASKVEYLKQQNELELYLMFLSDDDYNVLIEVYDRSILDENINMAMLSNLGVNTNCLSEDIYLIAINMLEQNVSYISSDYERGGNWNTSIGEISLLADENSEYRIFLNEKEIGGGGIKMRLKSKLL